MIIQSGRARAIVNAHSTGNVALTLEACGGGISLIGTPEKAEEIARALTLAAARARNTHPKEKPNG